MDRLHSIDDIKEIMARNLKLAKDKIGPSTRFDSTPSWDSLTHTVMMMELEETFETEFTVDEFAEMDSFDVIRETIAAKLQKS